MDGKITRKQAIGLIKSHGWKPEQQTAVDVNGNWVLNGSSFDETFGIKEVYHFKSVREWLGY